MNKLIHWVLHHRLSTISFFLLFTIFSSWILVKTPVDAIPDLSENQVIVLTAWSGQTPRNIEDQVTYPLASQLSGLVGVKDVRASSIVGLSMITVIFNDDLDIYFVRDRVAEKLNEIKSILPPGITPTIGPDATSLGQIYMYTIDGKTLDNYEKRSLQDFYLKYALQSVPGVAEVASVGGFVKQYQIDIDPLLLEAHHLTIHDIISTVSSANDNVSGKVVFAGKKEITVQGIGFLENIAEIKNIVLKDRGDGEALVLSDIANVRIGPEFRRTVLADDKTEQVGGVIIMRYGENTMDVIAGVKKKLAELKSTLPAGITIKPFYDRTTLIKSAIHTLTRSLIEEILIVTLVVGIFLWHLRSTLVISLSIPLGVLMAFVFMYAFKLPSNIMSLGGIAIGIGVMTDAAIVLTENIYRCLAQEKNITASRRLQIVYQASIEVIKPIAYSIIIIIIAFIPVFLLQGMEGKLFRPLAFTKTFAMLGALITSILLIPVLSYFFLTKKLKQESENPVVMFLQKYYTPTLAWSLAHKKKILIISSILLVVSLGTAKFIGSEFMPPLNEGSILYMPMTVPEVSEEHAREMLVASNKILAKFPEVERVVGKAGRTETATDPAPLSMLETFITLKDKKYWRRGMTKEKLMQEMNQSIKIDKLWNGFTQPIIGRIEMLSTGIRSEIGLKVFGPDPQKLEDIALEIEEKIAAVPGAVDISALRTMGVPYTNIKLDEAKMRAHGVKRREVLDAVAVGIGGKNITYSIQGRERYPIQIRIQQNYRDVTQDIANISVRSITGHNMTLGQVATITSELGPSALHSENGILRSVVQLNVRGRDLVGFVNEAKLYLKKNISLPKGYFISWDGQYKQQLAAKKRLTLIIPFVLAIIFFFLYITYHKMSLALIVFLSLPVSLAGGFISLFITRSNFSVAVWVGFIALFGIAVETAIVMIVYLEDSYKKRAQQNGYISPADLSTAIHEGAILRLRPKLMTAGTSIFGLVPMVFSHGTGAEVTRPLALVVMGGLLSSTFMVLVVLPVIFSMLKTWQSKHISATVKVSDT